MLRPEDFQTEAWKRFSKHIHVRIDELRKSNDTPHELAETAQIRGGISELKKILDLADEASSSNEVYPGEAGVDHSGHS